ncbi:hypothetical protein ACFS5N_09840 [Mucilaginibacter ximonensis]|uniref:Mannosyltransferase PIG-V n=1 Tax=Mucilaginibacter ximonensis TaxID=538021 RepID=A0ABW5YBX7_9SPHI
MYSITQFLTSKKNRAFTTIIFHVAIVLTVYGFLHVFYQSKYVAPTPNNLIRCDAYWYYTIKEFGYLYTQDSASNLAFFPLFPLVWRLTGLDILLISVFNLIIFCFSLAFLLKEQKLHHNIILLLLSFPSFIFFAVPYSESLFFLFCTLIVTGYKKDSIWLLCIGLFGAALTRSVCVIFVPAIILCELLNYGSKKTLRLRFLQTVYKLWASLGGLFLAGVYMARNDGKWFYFIELQKYWRRHWIIPQFPLTTIAANRVLGLDGIAFTCGVLAIFFIVRWVLAHITKKKPLLLSAVNQSVLFSALYIAGVTILDTSFSFNLGKSTSIWSINRHVMCTPFTLIFVIYLYQGFSPKLKEGVILILLTLFGFFFTGVYQHFNLNVLCFYSLFFLVFYLLKYYPFLNNYFVLYYSLAVFMQASFYSDFLNSAWIG